MRSYTTYGGELEAKASTPKRQHRALGVDKLEANPPLIIPVVQESSLGNVSERKGVASERRERDQQGRNRATRKLRAPPDSLHPADTSAP